VITLCIQGYKTVRATEPDWVRRPFSCKGRRRRGRARPIALLPAVGSPQMGWCGPAGQLER